MRVLSSKKVVLLFSFLFPIIVYAGFGTDFVTAGKLDLRVNTLSSVDTNGNILLDPNGTGQVRFPDLTATTVPYLDSNKGLVSSAITPTQLGRLGTVSSNLCGVSDTCTPTSKTIDGDDNTLQDIALSAIKTVLADANKFLTRDSSGTPVSLSATAATAALSAFTGDSGSGGVKGLVPAPSAGDAAADKYLKASGSWATVPSGFSNPMITGGDLIYGGTSGAATRLANGSSGQYLKSSGGTSAPAWTSFSVPTVQRFTSGSGTYTTPAGVKYIIVEMAGSGSGGAGSGTSTSNAGANGSATTFGSSLLTAGGGSCCIAGGGSATVNSPAIVLAAIPGGGGNGVSSLSSGFIAGGPGCYTAFGGGGAGGQANQAGTAAAGNSGSGGGGAGSPNPGVAGVGGSCAGYLKAQINSPSATYSYSVAASANGGTASSGGFAGGASGSGVIVVWEHYQ